MNMNTMPMAVLTIDGMQLAELRQAVLNNYQPPRATVLDLIDLLAVQPETPEPLAVQRQHAYLKGLREAKAIVWKHLVETGRKSRDLAAAHDLVMARTSIAYAALECMRDKPHADAGPNEPDAVNALHEQASFLLRQAERAGVVLTIERRSLKPLAMGHAEYAISTWPVRSAA